MLFHLEGVVSRHRIALVLHVCPAAFAMEVKDSSARQAELDSWERWMQDPSDPNTTDRKAGPGWHCKQTSRREIEHRSRVVCRGLLLSARATPSHPSPAAPAAFLNNGKLTIAHSPSACEADHLLINSTQSFPSRPAAAQHSSTRFRRDHASCWAASAMDPFAAAQSDSLYSSAHPLGAAPASSPGMFNEEPPPPYESVIMESALVRHSSEGGHRLSCWAALSARLSPTCRGGHPHTKGDVCLLTALCCPSPHQEPPPATTNTAAGSGSYGVSGCSDQRTQGPCEPHVSAQGCALQGMHTTTEQPAAAVLAGLPTQVPEGSDYEIAVADPVKQGDGVGVSPAQTAHTDARCALVACLPAVAGSHSASLQGSRGCAACSITAKPSPPTRCRRMCRTRWSRATSGRARAAR